MNPLTAPRLPAPICTYRWLCPEEFGCAAHPEPIGSTTRSKRGGGKETSLFVGSVVPGTFVIEPAKALSAFRTSSYKCPARRQYGCGKGDLDDVARNELQHRYEHCEGGRCFHDQRKPQPAAEH